MKYIQTKRSGMIPLLRDSDRTQTCNLLIRSQMLYSIKLRSLKNNRYENIRISSYRAQRYSKNTYAPNFFATFFKKNFYLCQTIIDEYGKFHCFG